MARNESQTELYDAELAPILEQKANMVLAACAAGHPVNTDEMIEGLGEYLGDSKKLAEIIREEIKGRPAFRAAVQKIAHETAGKQAALEMAEQGKHNRELSMSDRIHRYLDGIAA